MRENMRKEIKVYLTNGDYISIIGPNIEAKFMPDSGIVDIRRTFNNEYVSLYTILMDNFLYIDWGNDQ